MQLCQKVNLLFFYFITNMKQLWRIQWPQLSGLYCFCWWVNLREGRLGKNNNIYYKPLVTIPESLVIFDNKHTTNYRLLFSVTSSYEVLFTNNFSYREAIVQCIIASIFQQKLNALTENVIRILQNTWK